MKTNLTINELKKMDKNALRALNMLYGFNFEADFIAEKITGAFSLNKVMKIAGGDPINNKIVCIVVSDKTYYRNDLNTVEVFGSGASDFNITHTIRGFGFKTKIDYYFAKYRFNEERKTAQAAFVIVQNKKLLSGTYKEKKPDLTGRLAVKEINTICNGWQYRNYNYNENDFDKSGYFLADKRNNLQQRARALRATRKAAAFKAVNNTEIINGLRVELTTLKNAIAEKLTAAGTCEEVKKIYYSLSYYKGLADLYGDFEYIENGENNKTIGSIEKFNGLVNDLKRKIEELKKGVLI